MIRSILVHGLRYAFGLVVALALSSCAELKVTKVTPENDACVKGIRYYLPKPFLQVTPQADGTITVDVVYLPNSEHEYAIDTSSSLSAFTFQVARDEKGLLTAIEYKADTSIIGQQIAASGSATAAQLYNLNAAGAAAAQSQVGTAQTALDTANANLDAAKATLDSDQAHGASSATITSDAAAVAQAQAKQKIVETALKRAQNTAMTIAGNSSAGTVVSGASPISASGPSMGNAFGQPTWNVSPVYNLPDKFGPVLFAINDTGAQVELKAVTSTIPDSKIGSGDIQIGVTPEAEPTFETASTALGPPMLLPSDQVIPVAAKQAVFFFDRPIKTLIANVTTDAASPAPVPGSPKISSDGKSITFDFSAIGAGAYVLNATFTYTADSAGHTMTANQKAKFSVK